MATDEAFVGGPGRACDLPEIRELDRTTFAGLGCVEHGIVLVRGAASWGAHESGVIELPTRNGTLVVPIGYDEREAPYATDERGRERHDLLLSLTDEDDYLACAWAVVEPGSPVRGVGVDLSAAHHFRERTSGRDLSRLLFTDHERILADTLEDDPLLAYATVFASKEAAFKAMAAPLRRWYDAHERPLRFEVRHFVLEEPHLERGTGRNGAAQDAMDAMGVTRVVVRHACVCDMALVTAVALAE